MTRPTFRARPLPPPPPPPPPSPPPLTPTPLNPLPRPCSAGEARALFGTQNCLICTALGPTPPLEPVPAPAALCARCGRAHRPRAAGLPDGFLVKGAGVAVGTKVVRAINLSAGVYEVAVLQTVDPNTAHKGGGDYAGASVAA